MAQFRLVKLISDKEVHQYYKYLFKAFRSELLGFSNRKLIDDFALRIVFSQNDVKFLKKILTNAFSGKNSYTYTPIMRHTYEHPIELMNYIVQEGYTPSSPFVLWAHKQCKIRWNAMHWLIQLRGDIAFVDLKKIGRELKLIHSKEKLPQTLELYYRLGTGRERLYVDPDIGIKKVINDEFSGAEKYKGFNPIDYLDYYYGGLDKEDMTIAKEFYVSLLQERSSLKKRSIALIVGNGPVPDEAQALAMIPEVYKIIPADIDERNVNIMKMHTGRRNPLATQKARPGEEHADFIYYLFEKYTKAHFGLFTVREITAVKTTDPVYIDVSRINPLDVKGNTKDIKHLKPDLIIVPFCPESITNNLKAYSRYITNISSLAKPGARICMLALKDAKFYISGMKKLSATPINEKIIDEEFTKNGFTDIRITTIETGFDSKKRGFSDSMIVWATKM